MPDFDTYIAGKTVFKEDFQILISDADQSIWYPLLYDPEGVSQSGEDRQSCVESYELEGGPESPFETLTLKLSLKKLKEQYPSLYNNAKGFEVGKNRIALNAVGRSNMTMVKCKLRGTSLVITAYSDAEVLKGSKLAMGGMMQPYDWIKDILCSGSYGVTFAEGDTFLTSSVFPTDVVSEGDWLHFDEGENVWYVLQVCAMYMNCKIFFCDNRAYLVDMTQLFGSSRGQDGVLFDYETINLRPPTPQEPMYGRTVGDAELGDEGTDTVINALSGRCTDNMTQSTSVTVTVSNEESVQKYGNRAGNTLYFPTLIEGTYPDPNNNQSDEEPVTYVQASNILSNLISYRREPQQSVSFTVKEICRVNNKAAWVPCFQICSRVSEIIDDVNGIDVSNISDITGQPAGQLLNLSSYRRKYPEGNTTYTFGVISNIDLSESTSTILTQLGNVGS